MIYINKFLFGSSFKIELIKIYFNEKSWKNHKNIKFSVEFESSDSFSFLDTMVTQKSQVFITSIFRKKTFT